MKKSAALILLLMLCLSFNQFANAAPDLKREAGYVSLNSTKIVEVEPNVARVTFSIENTADDAQKAAYDNSVTSNNIIDALKKVSNLTYDDIKTANYSVRPIYASTKDGKRVIKNYMAVNSVTVETKDVKNIAKFIDTAIASGASRTDGLYYSYDNERAKCAELYPQILKDLKSQADTIAQSIGSYVDGVKIINVTCSTETNVSGNMRLYSSAKSYDAAAAETVSSTPIETSKVKVRVYVNADFYVK